MVSIQWNDPSGPRNIETEVIVENEMVKFRVSGCEGIVGTFYGYQLQKVAALVINDMGEYHSEPIYLINEG